MLLAIDAGNTNTEFAVMEGGEILGSWRISTDSQRTADEYGVWLLQLLSISNIERSAIDGAIIACVVPESLFNLRGLCDKYFGTKPMVVGDPALDLGISADIERPAEVGADRLVTALAAREKFGNNLIVIDFGTATTFDVVDEKGDFAGGVIAPGINLSIKSLYMAAAKLPRVDIRPTQSVIARSTVPAMQSGVFWGYIGMIEGLVARMRAELDRPVTIVATGGLATMFAGATSVIENIDKTLILSGLSLIYYRNKGK
ncbi:type III pantothenate kinase [Lacibacterium aquatile]|uniref:Type III pantothenate kinase n=1 Tax=Lacibacterium aquatile TaxID=1168082 RepID=A0ABW5DK12_9PROT